MQTLERSTFLNSTLSRSEARASLMQHTLTSSGLRYFKSTGKYRGALCLLADRKQHLPSEWAPNNRPPSGSESTFWNIGATAKLLKVQLIGGTFSPCSFHKQTSLPPNVRFSAINRAINTPRSRKKKASHLRSLGVPQPEEGRARLSIPGVTMSHSPTHTSRPSIPAGAHVQTDSCCSEVRWNPSQSLNWKAHWNEAVPYKSPLYTFKKWFPKQNLRPIWSSLAFSFGKWTVSTLWLLNSWFTPSWAPLLRKAI